MFFYGWKNDDLNAPGDNDFFQEGLGRPKGGKAICRWAEDQMMLDTADR